CTVAPQLIMQPPQWSGSVLRLTSQPLPALVSQSAKLLAEQLVKVQARLVHAMPLAFCTLIWQLVEHDPQCAMSLVRSTSQPLALLLSQSAKLVLVHEA